MIEYFNNIALIKEDNCICRFVRESGRLDHDQNVLPLLEKYIPKDGVVIDIGAFIGDHTINYADCVGENGKVYAIEPSDEAYDCLVFNSKNYKQIIPFNFGLGSKNEIVSISKIDSNSGMNFISEIKTDEQIVVKTIDTFFTNYNKLNRLDFIKIDCEGYEYEVLKGGVETINKFKPTMFIEINDMTLERQGIKRKEIYLYLDLLGYDYKNIYPNQSLDEYQMDIICEPKK